MLNSARGLEKREQGCVEQCAWTGEERGTENVVYYLSINELNRTLLNLLPV